LRNHKRDQILKFGGSYTHPLNQSESNLACNRGPVIYAIATILPSQLTLINLHKFYKSLNVGAPAAGAYHLGQIWHATAQPWCTLPCWISLP